MVIALANYLLDKLPEPTDNTTEPTDTSLNFSLLTSGPELIAIIESNSIFLSISAIMIQKIRGKNEHDCACIKCKFVNLDEKAIVHKHMMNQIKKELLNEVTKNIAQKKRLRE